jgi:diaminopimelate epimerase
MKLEFAKMHGIGNDFVVVDNTARRLDLSGESVRRIADRRRGIGFDQLLLVEPVDGGDAQVRLRIFNSDGEEVGQCGNGVRCVAVFMRDRDIASGNEMAIETGDRVVRAHIHGDDSVTVDMGIPALEPEEIPFIADTRASGYALRIDSDELDIGAVSLGNPHAVLRVDHVEAVPVAELGAAIQADHHFPEGVNVGFMQVNDEGHVRLRVCERGVGETLACGSGACAAVVVGSVRGWLGSEVVVSLMGGDLRIAWRGEGQPVWLTGPTARVFEGEIDL